MKKYIIRYPIWSGRAIGIRVDRLTDDLLVEIQYRDASGNRLYPDMYIVRKGTTGGYPSQVLMTGAELKVIPIDKLEVYKKADVKFKREHSLNRVNKALTKLANTRVEKPQGDLF